MGTKPEQSETGCTVDVLLTQGGLTLSASNLPLKRSSHWEHSIPFTPAKHQSGSWLAAKPCS
jgi:hypothetical protein